MLASVNIVSLPDGQFSPERSDLYRQAENAVPKPEIPINYQHLVGKKYTVSALSALTV